MQAPDFWYTDIGWRARMLGPLAHLYGAAARVRARVTVPYRASLPVLCVGNITVGGSGKTPTALALAHRLMAMGERPAFLTRGYGGRIRGPLLVDPDRAHATDVGDEALLLARTCATIVSANRPKGADAAATTGASVVIMDDGYQNPTLHKDAGFLVVDARSGLGNGRLMPAGPLRETAADALARASALVLIGDGTRGSGVAKQAAAFDVPVFHARLQPMGEPAFWRGKRLLAFAGIGQPDKFKASLAQVGADVVEWRAFADHHMYTEDEARSMIDTARTQGLELVTTAKDHARLSGARRGSATAELSAHALTLAVQIAFDEAAAVDALLAARLRAARSASQYKAF